MNVNDSIGTLKGVGPKTEKLLNKMGIYKICHLLEHVPRTYDTYEAPVKISDLKDGKKAAVAVKLTKKPDVVNLRRLQVVTAHVADGTGSLALKWYNAAYLRSTLEPGEIYVFRGKVTIKGRNINMDQPEVFALADYKKKLDFMQPIYPLTEGLTNNQMVKLIQMVLGALELRYEYLDEGLRRKFKLAEYNYSIQNIHFPTDRESMLKARERLAFDEFYLFALSIQRLKASHDTAANTLDIHDFTGCETFEAGLPYPLTKAQKRTWEEIKADFGGDCVMNRLIQGDVGSGKTVIAELALLAAGQAGYQGCLMAPTEVLARQHYEALTRDFEPFGLKVELLTGSMTAKEKRLAYERIAKHEADIIIGTHALIQEKVDYDVLGIVITDEQHRFGVRQREHLQLKGQAPHVLVMSATPIPRTLAMILYGDLDISVIDELPARRLPIKNCAVGTSYRPTAYHFIEKQIAQGHQAYVICPMVEESEQVDGEDVLSYTERLKQVFPPEIQVACLHGKMKPKEKNEIMEHFAAGEIQVLVSTTVVEVGVNVPNATVMMIEDAQRFGLAQLHQLRGRVGRGAWQSYCIFINTSEQDQANERLEVLVKSNDGFFIAGEDLRLRGPGDLFGLRQSGLMDFRIGDIFNDLNLLKSAGEAAKQLMETDPLLEMQPLLKEKLDEYMRHTMDNLVL